MSWLGPLWVLFAVTNPLFLILFVVLELLTIAALAVDDDGKNHPGGALFLIIATLLFCGFFTDSHIFVWLFNWKHFFAVVFTFVPVGLSWSFFRWQMLLGKRRSAYEKTVAEFISGNAVSAGVTRSTFDAWVKKSVNNSALVSFRIKLRDAGFSTTKSGYGDFKIVIKPPARQYEDRLTCWAAFWPWDIVAYFFGTFLKDVFNSLCNLFSNWYDLMAAWNFKGVSEIDD